MALHEEFVESGRWLFRRRAYLPVALLPVVLAQVWATARRGAGVEVPWTFACFLVSLVGLGIRAYAVGHAAPQSSGRERQRYLAEDLNTTGAYSVTRHPLYLANALMWLGPVLVPRTWWLLAVIGLACWLFYERITFAEEEFLRASFGERHLQWARRTPSFLPSWRHWSPPTRPFNLRSVLRREYSALFQLVLVFGAINALQWRASTGRWALSPFWLWTLVTGVGASAVLRLLWKRTTLLQDRPRAEAGPNQETKRPARQSRTGPDAVAGDAGVPSRPT
jgi:protein-S-isoprenylcysteine O-methyltransferase Ste14